jgi:hypothetical protein
LLKGEEVSQARLFKPPSPHRYFLAPLPLSPAAKIPIAPALPAAVEWIVVMQRQRNQNSRMESPRRQFIKPAAPDRFDQLPQIGLYLSQASLGRYFPCAAANTNTSSAGSTSLLASALSCGAPDTAHRKMWGIEQKPHQRPSNEASTSSGEGAANLL